MQKTEAELKHERQWRSFVLWTASIIFVFSVAVLLASGYPLYYAVGGAILTILAVPLGLIYIVLSIFAPIEAIFFAFMLLLSLLIWSTKRLVRKKYFPEPMRRVRKWLYNFRYILQELKGPYITAIVVLSIYWWLRNLFGFDKEPAPEAT